MKYLKMVSKFNNSIKVMIYILIAFGLLGGCNGSNTNNAVNKDNEGIDNEGGMQNIMGATEVDWGNVGALNRPTEINMAGNDITSVNTSLNRDNSKAVLTNLLEGRYIVGDSVPEGRYKMTGNGNGTLIIYDHYGVPYINEIFGEGDEGVSTVTTHLEEGFSIEVLGLSNVLLTPVPTVLHTDTLSAGTWVVGLDIAPGNYQIFCEGKKGHLFVYNMLGWLTVNESFGEEDFEVEEVNVDLQEGDTIEISGMDIVRFSLR